MHSSDHRGIASLDSLKWVFTKKIESNRRVSSLHNKDRFLGVLPAFGHKTGPCFRISSVWRDFFWHSVCNRYEYRRGNRTTAVSVGGITSKSLTFRREEILCIATRFEYRSYWRAFCCLL